MFSFVYACILLSGGSSASSSALEPRNAYLGGEKTEGGRGGGGIARWWNFGIDTLHGERKN